ncbi:MAG: hypothetical protein GY797_29525 [Deltaproteobacteria bacterium]|nr:hypothetical protein [Deltaproteobacteria bacterium]
MANSGGLALAPLAFVSPLAYQQRRKKKMRKVTAVLMALAIIALGVGMASAYVQDIAECVKGFETLISIN